VSEETLQEWAAECSAQELYLQAEDGVSLYGWRLGQGSPLVLYFGGNGSTVGAPVSRYEQIISEGMSLLHVNYRGYPGSGGRPFEDGVLRDARAAWKEARRTHGADEIVVMGRSLGGGVAVGLVSALPTEERPRALVLESTFSSVIEVGKDFYPFLPVGLLMRNRFDSLSRSPRVSLPTLVVHSQDDELISWKQGEALAQAIDGARFVAVSGMGHNDDSLGMAEPWRVFLEIAGATGN
jgi:hypothetical protein